MVESSFEVHHFPRAVLFLCPFTELLFCSLPAFLKETIQNNHSGLRYKTFLALSQQEDASLTFRMLRFVLCKMVILGFFFLILSYC